MTSNPPWKAPAQTYRSDSSKHCSRLNVNSRTNSRAQQIPIAACLGFQRWMMMGNVKRAPLWTPAVGSLWVSASDACQVPFGPLPRSLKGNLGKNLEARHSSAGLRAPIHHLLAPSPSSEP